MTHITLDQVSKRFGEEVAVDKLSLTIESGEFFSLLGPSGCGKTTTMRMIAGLETPSSGRIWIGDQCVFDHDRQINVSPGKRNLGMVFQNYALWPHMTVRDNIQFGLKVRGLSPSEQQRETEGVLKTLQIPDLGERYPSELSGGQQQRVALARELVTGVGLLLMDEPLSNLDARLRIDMRVELKELHERTGRTIVYVTHDQGEALTLSTRIMVMKQGKVQQLGTPDAVFMQPANRFTASFMGSASLNEFTGQLNANGLQLSNFNLPLPPGHAPTTEDTDIILAARPDELSLHREPDDWCVPGEVISVLPSGYIALAHIALKPGQEPKTVTVEFSRREWEIVANQQLYVRFNPDMMHLFQATSEQRICAGDAGCKPPLFAAALIS